MKLFYRIVTSSIQFYFSIFYRHKVYGRENLIPGPAIIAPNHVSFYDPPVVSISCKEEVYFLARATLFEVPILKTIIKNLNAYPVSGTSQDLASFKTISELLQQGKKVVIFPEGVRSWDNILAPIKAGIGMLAMRNKCPIIPTYIYGTYKAWNRHNKFPKPWGKTACIFGRPIYWEDYAHLDKKQAQEQIGKAVEKSIQDLRANYESGLYN